MKALLILALAFAAHAASAITCVDHWGRPLHLGWRGEYLMFSSNDYPSMGMRQTGESGDYLWFRQGQNTAQVSRAALSGGRGYLYYNYVNQYDDHHRVESARFTCQ